MALVDYSILTIGLVPIPLSADLTATVSSGLNSRKVFTYKNITIPAVPTKEAILDDKGNIIAPAVVGSPEKKDISVKGEDNITLTLTQSNDSVANKLFSIINSVLAVAVGVNSAVDLYSNNFDLQNTLKKAQDLILKQLTICSYFDLSGDGSFFNYRLVDCSFDKQLNEGITSISFTFSNYYNDSLSAEEVEKINNITKVG